jgi:prepilin-type N-terminal cleavage/methylation domain-containing protein
LAFGLQAIRIKAARPDADQSMTERLKATQSAGRSTDAHHGVLQWPSKPKGFALAEILVVITLLGIWPAS